MTNPTYRIGDFDPRNVDVLAVEFACNGTKMRLNRDSQVVAILRMYGLVESWLIAERVCSTERQVHRIVEQHGKSPYPIPRRMLDGLLAVAS